MKRSNEPKGGTMQHDRAVLIAVGANIGGIQPLGQDEIDLERAALPVPTDRIGKHKFQLRPVECAFTGIQLRLDTRRAGRLQQRVFDLVPNLVRSSAFFRAVREFDREAVESPDRHRCRSGR